jgi:hypothetical protein
MILYASLTGAMAVTALIFWVLLHEYDGIHEDEDSYFENDTYSDPQKKKIMPRYRRTRSMGSYAKTWRKKS